jgi:ADP-ribose pyrophosphatase YjhB (NUDIX family)
VISETDPTATTAPLVTVAGLWQLGAELVLVRAPSEPRWRLPGATVRTGETLAEALVRGVGEDTGADALCGPFVGWGEVVAEAPDEHRLTMYFEVVVLDTPHRARGSSSLPDGPSGTEVRSTPDWEISELPVVPGLAEFLADQGLIELVV